MTLNALQLRMHQIQHVEESLFDHGQRVSALLESWGLPSFVVVAGLYHSIYGRTHTRFAPPAEFSQRHAIEGLLGVAAEKLIFLNCVYTAESFWRCFHFNELQLEDRLRNSTTITVDHDELNWLLHISLANMMDHVPQGRLTSELKWRELSLFIQYSMQLGPKAREAFAHKIGISLA